MAGIMITNANEAVARRVRFLCEEREWTYYRLAIEAGLSHSTTHAIVHNERQSVSLNSITKICEACSISLEDFFAVGFSDIPPQE